MRGGIRVGADADLAVAGAGVGHDVVAAASGTATLDVARGRLGLDVARRDPEVEVHVARLRLGADALRRDVAGADVARLRLQRRPRRCRRAGSRRPRRCAGRRCRSRRSAVTSPESVSSSSEPPTPLADDVAGGGADVDRGADGHVQHDLRVARPEAEGRAVAAHHHVRAVLDRAHARRVQRALGAGLDVDVAVLARAGSGSRPARRRPSASSPGPGSSGGSCARPRRSSSPRPARPRAA